MPHNVTGTTDALIRRSDYTPPLWRVQRIVLDVDLDPARTRVRASLSVERSGEHLEPLRLNGDGLHPLAVTVDGRAVDSWTMDGDDLLIPLGGKAHIITTEVGIAPCENLQLMGLYMSGQTFCTQCEAQGFRRITFFPDRPDILTEYQVRMSADEARFPVLLSNGNRIGGGREPGGRHWAEWHDPIPKSSYLFAMVAGDLAANRSTFTTRSGRTVALAAWANAADIHRTEHALASLKAAMAWDEENYGREYDLGEFNLVAVDDFNFGAMENKGLNIFNSRFILADSETATDSDYDQITATVAHEYFHNWSGNRVTCRDWFQLGLNEGLTVYRDQSFSGDHGSHMLKRIEDVEVLQTHQFPEDAGPLAHPVRPDSYTGIASLYTATIYRKGAELVRMLAVLLGPARFRVACDLYFSRYDGEAVTVDDFLACMKEASGIDLSGFRPWYDDAGTPRVECALTHDEDRRRATITLRQLLPTAGHRPRLIPLRLRLLDRNSGLPASEERLISLTAEQESFEFENIGAPPLVSVNRGFTAPVIIEHARDADELALVARIEDDPFLRYQALQHLMLRSLVEVASGGIAPVSDIVDAVATTLAGASLDPAFAAEAVRLPGPKLVTARLDRVDPEAVWRARQEIAKTIGTDLEHVWREIRRAGVNAPYSREPEAKGRRRLRNVALAYLIASGAADADELAYHQFVEANNMTDREAALTLLADGYSPLRERALEIFRTRFAEQPLVIDKWFAIQARATRTDTAEQVERLSMRADFNLSNPNRARSLIENFGQNQRAFHSANGAGYRWLARQTLAFDAINPRTAAKFLAPLAEWRNLESRRAALMRTELQAIAATPGISKDLSALAEKSLISD